MAGVILAATTASTVFQAAAQEQANRDTAVRVPPDPAPPEDFLAHEATRIQSGSVAGHAGAVAVTGGAWTPQGPGPTINGQVENIPGTNPVVGAIEAVVAHPTDPDTLWIGAVNGGIWRTSNATAASPNWEPLTDGFRSLSIGDMRMDPTDASNQTLVAGIGAVSSFGRSSGPMTGLLRTTDGGTTWTQLGQVDLAGRNISSVVARGNTILVGAISFGGGVGAGVYRSTDGGANFNLISGIGGLNNGQAFDLAEDPSNPNRIYAGIGGGFGGVFRTDDAGATWTDVTDAAIAGVVGANTTRVLLSVSAAAPNPVYVGIVNNGQLRGFFRSADQGANWTAMDIPQVVAGSIPITGATNATPIVITSNNHGLTNNEQPQVRITGVTGNTAANGDFFVTVVDVNNFSLNGSAGNGAYAGGGTWGKITGLQPRVKPGSQGALHFSVLADPSDPNVVFVGGDRQDFPNPIGATDFSGRLFRGDAGVAAGGPGAIPSPQWEHLTHSDAVVAIPGGGTASTSSPHADSRGMTFDANGDIIEVDDGGIYRRTSSQDNTGDWFSVIGDLQVTEFHDIAYDRNSDIIIGGAQDTGMPEQTATGSFTWNSVSTADGGDVAVDVVTLAPLAQSIRYSSTQNLGGFRRIVYDAANNQVGARVGLIPAGGLAGFVGQFVTPIAVSNVVPVGGLPAGQSAGLVIGGGTSAALGINVGAVYEANNAGVAANAASVNWVQVPTGAGFAQVNRVAIDYGGMSGGVPNPNVLYVGSQNRVFLRTTAGGTLNATSALPAGAGNIVGIVMDPNEWRNAFAIDTGRVYWTRNAGDTWQEITGNLGAGGEGNFRAIEYVANGAHDKLLVGTDFGVFAAVVPSFGCWFRLGQDLPNAPVWDLDYDAVDDLAVAGTLGRGAWTLINVADLGIPILSVPGPIAFGDVCVGDTGIAKFNVCNTGFENLEIFSITSSDPQFAVTTPTSGFPVVISKDFCFPFQATFSPTSAGPHSAVFTIESNSPCDEEVEVDATGTGTEPNIVTVIADDGDFRNVCRGDFKDLDLTISNSGNCPLVIDDITSSSAEFETASVMVFPLVIGAKSSTAVPVRFAPTTLGAKNATITIVSNDPDTPNKVVNVSGNVPPGEIRVTGSTDFGEVCAETLAEKEIDVCNVGLCNLDVTNVSVDCPDFTIIENPFPSVVSHDFCVKVVIRFTPTSCSEPGEQKECTLTINSDDPVTPVVTRTLTGRTPCASIDVPGDLAFLPTVIQSVDVCETLLPFPVSNTGNCNLHITAFEITDNPLEFGVFALPSFPIILEPGHIAGEGDLAVVFAPEVIDRNRLGEVSVTWVHDPVTGAEMTAGRDLCGEGVLTGARVLVTHQGVPLDEVKSIKLLRINANRRNNILRTVDNARDLPLQTITPAAPCPEITFHREYGTVDNPFQLLPGSYEVSVMARIDGKNRRKNVGFRVGSCGFNPNIVVNFE